MDIDQMKNMEVTESDAFITRVHSQVLQYNKPEWRRQMMTLEEKMREIAELTREEGKAETKLEIARKLKSKGLNPSEIVEITGLTREEVERILL